MPEKGKPKDPSIARDMFKSALEGQNPALFFEDICRLHEALSDTVPDCAELYSELAQAAKSASDRAQELKDSLISAHLATLQRIYYLVLQNIVRPQK